MFDDIKLPMKRVIEKADVDESSLPNSVLNRQQADRFIDLVVDYSVLLKRIRVQRVNHQKGQINKLDLGSIVTQGAHTTSTVTTRTPSESIVEYDTEKYRSAFDLTSDFTEDNLEGSAFRNKLVQMFTKRIAIDTELAAIQGDESLTTGDGASDTNNLLGVNDGFKELLSDNVPSGQKIDVSGAAASKKLFYEMKRRIPARYRVAMPNYVWVVGSSIHDKWTLDISDRATAQGDAAIRTGMAPGPFGIPMLEIPLMPEDLTVGTNSDGTQIWLTPLQNLIYFIQRNITIEWDRQPRQDKWEVTVHFRADFQVENANLIVTAYNVRIGGTDYS
jgi:HK97 family phage major capsid protein